MKGTMNGAPFGGTLHFVPVFKKEYYDSGFFNKRIVLVFSKVVWDFINNMVWFVVFLEFIGFFAHPYGVYVKYTDKGNVLLICLYVDDMLIRERCLSEIGSLKRRFI